MAQDRGPGVQHTSLIFQGRRCKTQQRRQEGERHQDVTWPERLFFQRIASVPSDAACASK